MKRACSARPVALVGVLLLVLSVFCPPIRQARCQSPSLEATTPATSDAAEATAATSDDRLLDPTNDRIVASARMPRDDAPQAEVRLIRRDGGLTGTGHPGDTARASGGAAVVQTVVYSRVLRRVVAAIRDKEVANWPPDRSGHDDSAAYVGALEATANDAWHAFLQRGDRRERHQSIVIELVLASERSLATFYVAHVRADGDTWNVVRRDRARVLDLPRAYVRKDMELIAADALGIDADEATRRIDALTTSTKADVAKSRGDRAADGR